jgi:benzodiazapine receptor
MSAIDRLSALLDRPDRVGLATTIAAFVGVAVIVNAIIFAIGIGQGNDAVTRLSWAPPGWVIGAIWVVLFAFYAVAHWLLRQRGDSGRRAARWVVAIVLWDLAYPLLTWGFDLVLGASLNVVSIVLTVLLLGRVRRESRAAFGWLIPSLAWVCFATVLTFVALQRS